jgi:hypothetical protein
MSRRLISAALAVTLSGGGAAIAGVMQTPDERAYQAENARLARTTPHYPRARVLVDESIWGENDETPFEAIQRVYRLATPSTQRNVLSFYKRRLGRSWRPRGDACLVSRKRAVVALLYPKRRRVGIVIDSRGATYCLEHVANIAILLELGYPD